MEHETALVYGSEDAAARQIERGEVGLTKFISPSDVQPYVDRVLAKLPVDGYGGRATLPVKVRERRGAAKASYEPTTNTIAIPTREVGGAWALNEFVVLHELAHHLAPAGAGHSSDFRAVFVKLLEDIGRPAAAQTLRDAYVASGLDAIGSEVSEGVLSKISKLLRQSERGATEEERAAFFQRAQVLATKNSLALAVARAHAEAGEKREEVEEIQYHLGKPRERGLVEKVSLISGIGSSNDVKVLIWHGNTRVSLIGFKSDIEVVTALYESLVSQLEFAWVEYDAEYRRTVPAGQREHAMRRKLSFYQGYCDRVIFRLREAAKAAVAEIEETSTETSLVLRNKQLEVGDWVNNQYPNLGSWSGVNRFGTGYTSGSEAGQSASFGTEKGIE